MEVNGMDDNILADRITRGGRVGGDTRTVTDSIEALQETVDNLESSLNRIFEHLSPVLGPMQSDTEEYAKDPTHERSPVVGLLDGLRLRLTRLRREVDSLNERVEL